MPEAASVEPFAAPIGGRAAATGAARDAGPLAQFCWALCDGSRGPYSTLVNIFVYSAYFSTVVVPDAVRGQVLWSYITSAAALLVALGAPVLGAIADAGGRRKPWLAGCLVLALPSMSALWFATPGMGAGFAWVMLAPIGGTLAFEYSSIFCNAMLPNIAPPRRFGFLSGLGFSLANLFGIALFLFFLIAWSWRTTPLFGLDPRAHEPERAVGILAGLWMVAFSLPLFFFTPDSPGSSLSAFEAVARGVRNLIQTLRKVGRYRNVALFLGARMIYNEGFIVLMLFTGVFAAGILHWTPGMLITEGLINSIVATLAGLGAGWLDQRFGSRRSTLIFVLGCILCNVILCSITPDSILFVKVAPGPVPPHGLFPTLPDRVFLVTQCLVAAFVTGGLVTSRALMAKLSPPDMLNEFFGLYAMSGTATSFVGPLAIGLLTTVFYSQRAGVAVGIVFLTVGLLLMIAVREPRA